MNKAFMREPDDNGQRFCPRCQSLGVALTAETWRAHVAKPGEVQLAEQAYFCPFPRCDVVYFDEFDRVAVQREIAHPVYPKDADAPLCGCFGLTADDVEQDLREGALRECEPCWPRAKHPRPIAECSPPAVSAVSARCSAYYMKRRSELGGG